MTTENGCFNSHRKLILKMTTENRVPSATEYIADPSHQKLEVKAVAKVVTK